MTVGSQAFAAEDVVISIMKKGDTGSQVLHTRLTGVTSSGLNRSVQLEKTFGTHLHRVNSYGITTVSLNFIVDVGLGSSFESFIGETTTSNLIRKTVLNNTIDFYKIKLEYNDYSTTGSYNQTSSSTAISRSIFYNVYGTSYTNSISTDDAVVGTLTFSMLPFNTLGSSNFVQFEKDEGSSLISLNLEESAYDTIMGY